MFKKRILLAVAAVAVLGLGTQSAFAASATIKVPSGFDKSLSDTRSAGHYAVQGTGLHIFTDDSSSQAKVAEYVATTTALASVGEPKLNFTNTSSGGIPGFQLVVDFNNDGTADGILVGEPGAYGNDWWLTKGSAAFVKALAPSHEAAGFGSGNHGTLEQWRSAFPTATVRAFGFSLGSGVKGDGVLDSIDFAGTNYTFAMSVVLKNKAECKNGGWATSDIPVFTDQGQCVKFFTANK